MKRFLVIFSILLFQYSLPYTLSANSTIRVGVYNNEPLLFADTDGKGKGVFADIIEHVASKEGWQIEYVTGTWDQCLSRLENNQIDILGTIAFTKARGKLYDFGKENLMTNWGQLYTPAESDIKMITDVAGKKVAVLKGDIHYSIFTQIIERFGIECEFIEMDNYSSVLDLVSRNQADAGVVNRFFGMKYGSKYKLGKSGVIFNPIKLYYAVPKGENKELIDTIDRYIVFLKGNESSEYYRSLGKWFGAVSVRLTFPTWAKWTILVSLGLVVFLFLGNLVLRIRVKAKTKELTTELKERRKAEEALLESEERFRSLFEGAPDAIFLADPESGKILEANPAASRLLLRPKEEIIGLHQSQLHPPRMEKYSRTSFSEHAGQKEETRSVENFVLRSDGSETPVEVMAQVVRIKGKPALQGVFRDITERKRAEKALRESEERYRSLIHRIQVAVVVHDADTQIIASNPKAQELLGLKEDQVLGKKSMDPDWNFLRADGERLSLEEYPVNQVVATQQPLRDSTLGVYRSDKGDVEWMLVNADPVLDGKGKIQQVIVTFIDITDRKHAEEVLRESEAQKKAILDASIDRIRLVDTDMRIIWANKTTAREVNIPPEDLVGQYCYKVFVGRDSPCTECPTKKALHSRNIEHAVTHQPYSKGIKGETYWDIYAVPLKNDACDIVNCIQVARNITDKVNAEEEKKKLESQFQQAQKMESICTLAGGIAHNFNNVLMGIQGNTSLMLFGKTSDHPDYEKLNNIEQGVLSGTELTKQLLGFARGGRYEIKPIDLNEHIKSQNRMFGRTKKEITIRGIYQDNLWAVEVDQAQINQVILNLYVNAWQAMPKGGDLYIQTENVSLDESYTKPFNIDPGNYVKISINDTGVGMDEETKKRIFEPFFTTQEIGSGTGLGLASVYGIIKNHGGIINVYSVKGEGSTFTIYLPASEKEIVKEEKAPERVLKGTETVLLVDDEDTIIDVGERILKTLGYTVLVARSGKQAIDIVSKAHRAKRKEEEGKKRHAPSAMPPAPDIVILDMIMPGIGGGETYDRIKEINPDMKVLLSSGYSINGQATEILERGCNGFLQKPFTLKELSTSIREVLDEE